QCGADLLQGQPGFDAAQRLVGADMHALVLARLLANVPGAQLIDPDRLRDPEHPAVEPRPLLKLMHTGQGPFARRLDEIIRLGSAPRQTARETPQARQNGDELVAEGRAHRRNSAEDAGLESGLSK